MRRIVPLIFGLCLGIAPAYSQTVSRYYLTDAAMIRALGEEHIYVAPAADRVAPVQPIEARLRVLGSKTMVVIVDRLPAQYRSAADLARACHASFPFYNEPVVAVCDNPRSIAVANSGLDTSAVAEIMEESSRTFDSEGYAAGIAQLVGTVDNRRHTATVRRTEQLGGPTLLVLALLVAAGYGLWRKRGQGEARAGGPAIS